MVTYYNSNDIQKIFKLSKTKTNELLNTKGFPSFKVGGQFRVSPDRLAEWVDRQIMDRNDSI